MGILSLIAALVLEQFRPLNYRRWVAAPVARLAVFVEHRLNAGGWQHGALAWALLAGGATLLTMLVFYLLLSFNLVAAWAWNVAVLYVTMGFRQFSHPYTEIHLALRMGEIERARSLLADWREEAPALWSSSDIARLSIERALLDSHRHVFAVLLWFVMLPGPAGAVLYRVSALLSDAWAGHGEFGAFARKAFRWADWLPQRVTATGFAIVGDFEDAVHCWRTQAAQWVEGSAGIVLAAGAGALGVRLGMPVEADGEVRDRTELGPDIGTGAEADVDFMQSGVGLVWRALVLWLLVLFMLSLATLVG